MFLFILQSVDKAKDYFKRRIEYITKQIEKIQPILQEKYKMKQGMAWSFYLFLLNALHSQLIFSRHFLRQQDLTCHANCLQWRQFAWNVKSHFLGKIRKMYHQCVICWINPESEISLAQDKRVLRPRHSKNIVRALSFTPVHPCICVRLITTKLYIFMNFHRWLNHIKAMCNQQGRQLWLIIFGP